VQHDHHGPQHAKRRPSTLLMPNCFAPATATTAAEKEKEKWEAAASSGSRKGQ
jgi:hypothetical protein